MPFLGIFLKEMRAYVHEKLCTRIFIAYLIITGKNKEQSKYLIIVG